MSRAPDKSRDPIAINTSAAQLRSDNFVAHLLDILKETGLEPHYLEFELTETAFMQDPESTVAVLQAFTFYQTTSAPDIGVRVT
jgi:EAL domain-containing protein (putative c-di-GMP-specific phosphodiesterase class I)